MAITALSTPIPGSRRARSHKAARTETQLLAHAFFDDTPEISVEGKTLTTGWLHRIQQVFRNALALCQAVHLLDAKALDQQIANMCLLQPDPALSLRTVTTSELLHADRQIWGTIVDLLQRKWSMDDAFHELTHGRMEIHSLLMLRPRTSRQPLAKRPTNPARSGKRPAPKPHKAEPPRKKGKGKGKGKTRNNWAATHQGKPICRRFQQGLCKTDNCQFAHVCAIKGCQQAHGASQHPSNRT